jgi:hypothetical protein
MERAKEVFYRLRDDTVFYQHQIYEAVAHNKEKFDSERYLVKRQLNTKGE